MDYTTGRVLRVGNDCPSAQYCGTVAIGLVGPCNHCRPSRAESRVGPVGKYYCVGPVLDHTHICSVTSFAKVLVR